ncbi:MAG TPA: MlaD family protein [Syntrophorhabdaceae bacterium]|nr:MlaD family protein [Syntrophorhabdaceae bacterium]
MKKSQISPELKVGILVLIGFIILFYMSVRIGKFGVLSDKGYDLTVYLENAGGLDAKSPVLIAGVEIGRIRSVKLEGYKALIRFSVRDDVKIPADSVIAVRTQGVLGDKYLEILPGKDKKMLSRGEQVGNVLTSPSFDEIFTQVSKAAKKFGDTVGEFQGILGEKEKVGIKKSIDNIQAITGEFKDIIKDNKQSINSVIANADDALKGLKKIVGDVESGKGSLGMLLKDDKLYNDAKDTMSALKNITTDIDQGKGSLGKLAKDDSLYNEAKDTVKNLKDITDGVKKGEGTLGKLAKDDSLYIETERAMKKLQKGADGISEMTPITILGTIFGLMF